MISYRRVQVESDVLLYTVTRYGPQSVASATAVKIRSRIFLFRGKFAISIASIDKFNRDCLRRHDIDFDNFRSVLCGRYHS